MEILVVILILGIFIGIPLLLEYNANKKEEQEKNSPIYISQEDKWEQQEEQDKQILNSNPIIKKQMEASFNTLQIIWGNIVSQNNDTFQNSLLCLEGLTINTFIQHYIAFKTQNYNAIKNEIYKERPYFTLDLLIKMGIYIFETNNHINILNHIIKSKSKKYEEYKELAKTILDIENKYKNKSNNY